ncbi:MAG: cadmium-translocating P-type ATPase [Lachnospiraceae bacterium]|nr:cadmium-translocating P-type ATPase [Lachnospiraceae bacterium]
MTKKLKKRLLRILLGAALFVAAVAVDGKWSGVYADAGLIAFLAAFLVCGGDVIKKAAMNITKGQIFDENFLMTVATVGAFLVGEYPEGVAVMLFYQVGEWFQSYAVNKSRKSIRELMNIRPDYANVCRDGGLLTVDPGEVKPGELIVVKPGERIPLDGTIEKGSTALDTMELTGESLPREAGEGDSVISGCVNQSAVIEVRVTKEFGESTVSRILELVENAGSRKSESENFISKFARYYTPVVVGLAALLAVIPPLATGGDWYTWIYRALSFLVVSCPCALVISIPLSFFGGLGGASRAGILIKGSNYLEALSKAEIVVMDKTGTLTKGNFAVSRIVPKAGEAETLLELTAYAESGSNHPISRSLQQAYGEEIDRSRIKQMEETAGFGVSAVIDGRKVLAGNLRYLEQNGIACAKAPEIGTVVYTACDGAYLGYIVIADELKPDAAEAVRRLKDGGIQDIVMLTGDRKETAEAVAKEIGIDHVYAELLPGDKVDRMEELLSQKSPGGKLVFVGDGMNDAPVLARSDIGIAMGGLGSDAAIEAADVVIMTDEPSKIARAMEISRRTLVIVKQNIIFAIGVKGLILILAACGIASMWTAVFGDVGVAVIAILNAMRALKA